MKASTTGVARCLNERDSLMYGPSSRPPVIILNLLLTGGTPHTLIQTYTRYFSF